MAGIIDWIRSLSRCAPLSATRMGSNGRRSAEATMVMPGPLDPADAGVNRAGCIAGICRLHPPAWHG